MDDNLPFGDPSDFDSLFSNGDQIGGSLFDTDALMPDVFGSSQWSPVTNTLSSASPDLLETMVTAPTASTAGGQNVTATIAMDTEMSTGGASSGEMKIPIPRVSSLDQPAGKQESQVLKSANWMQNSGGNIIHISSDTLEHRPAPNRSQHQQQAKAGKTLDAKGGNQASIVEQLSIAESQAELMNVRVVASNNDIPNKSNQVISMATSSSGHPVQMKGTVIQPAILHQLPNSTQLQKLLIQGSPAGSGISIPTIQTLQSGQPSLQLVSVQQPSGQGQPLQQMTLNTHGVAVNPGSGQLVIQRPGQAGLQALQATSQVSQPTVTQIQALQIQASNSGSQVQGIQVNSSTPNILLRTLPASNLATGSTVEGGQSPLVVAAQNNALHLLPSGQILGSNLANISLQNQGRNVTTSLQGHLGGEAGQVDSQQVSTHHTLTATDPTALQASTTATDSNSSQPQHSISGLQGLNIGNGISNVNIVASEAQVFNNIMLGTSTQSGQTSQLNTGEHGGLTVKIGNQIVNLHNLQNAAQIQQKLQQQQLHSQQKQRIASATAGESGGVVSGSTNSGNSGNSNPLVLGLPPGIVKTDPLGSLSSQSQQMIQTQTVPAVKPTELVQSGGKPAIQLNQLLGKQQQQQQTQPLIQVNVAGGKVIYLTQQQVQLLQQKAKQQRAIAQQNAASRQLQQVVDTSSSQLQQRQQFNSMQQLQPLQPKVSSSGQIRQQLVGSRGSSLGGKHPAGNSLDSGQAASTGPSAAKKRARGKRSQSSASEMSQHSPASVKSYHSPASVQSIPPESPSNSGQGQIIPPASPAGSMGPPSNAYLPPSPAGSIGPRSIVSSMPPPSPAGSMGPPSNLQGSNPPPSPSGSNTMGSLSNIQSHMSPSPAIVKSQVPQSPQGPTRSPMGPVQTLPPPNSLAGMLGGQLNNFQPQMVSGSPSSHSIKVMGSSNTTSQISQENIGYLSMQTRESTTELQKAGLEQLRGQEGALPPDLEQIDLFSPTGDNLDIFDSNNDLLDTVSKDLLGTDEQDDVTSLSLNQISQSEPNLHRDNSGIGSLEAIAGDSKAVTPGKVTDQDDVLQYYIKQVREQSSNTQEELQQSIEAMMQQKDVTQGQNLVALGVTNQLSQENEEMVKNVLPQQILQQPQHQQSAILAKLGLSLSGGMSGQKGHMPSSDHSVSRPEGVLQTLQTQERLKHVHMLAKRQRELQALARQQRMSSEDSTMANVAQGNSEGGIHQVTTSVTGAQGLQQNANLLTIRGPQVSPAAPGLLMKQTRSLSDTAVQPTGENHPHSNQQDRRQSIGSSSEQQQGQGSIRKLQQLLEAGDPYSYDNAMTVSSQTATVNTSMITTGTHSNMGMRTISAVATRGVNAVNISSPASAVDIPGIMTSGNQSLRTVSTLASQGAMSTPQSVVAGSNVTSGVTFGIGNVPGAANTLGARTSLSSSSGTATLEGLSSKQGISISGSQPTVSITRTNVAVTSSTPLAPQGAIATQQGVLSSGTMPTQQRVASGSIPARSPSGRVSQLQAALQQIQRQAFQQELSQEQVLSVLRVALQEDGGLQKLLAHALPGSQRSESAGREGRTENSIQSQNTSTAPNSTSATQLQNPSSELPPHHPQQPKVALATGDLGVSQPVAGAGAAWPGGDGNPIKRTPVVYLNPKHDELLKRIQEHIRILRSNPNRTPQQNDFMKQLIDGEKRILRFGRIEALKLQNAQLKNQQGAGQSQHPAQQIQHGPGVSQPLIGSQSSGAAVVTSSFVTPQSSGHVTTVTTQSITKLLTPADTLSGSQQIITSSSASHLQNAAHKSPSVPTVVTQVRPPYLPLNQTISQYPGSNSKGMAVPSSLHPPTQTNAPIPEVLKGLLSEDGDSAAGSKGNAGSVTMAMSSSVGTVGNLQGEGMKVGTTGRITNLVPGNSSVVTSSGGTGNSGDVGVVSAEMAKQKIEKLMQLLAPSVRQQLVTKLSQMSGPEQQAFYRQQVSLIMKMQRLKAQQSQTSQAKTPTTQSVQIDRPQPNASLVKQLMQPDSSMDGTDQLDGTSRSAGHRTQQSVTSSGDVAQLATGPPLSTQLVMDKSSSQSGQRPPIHHPSPKLQTMQLPPSKSSLQMLTRPQLFQLQLKKDQQGALKPDATSGFKNYKDAIKRLIKYHVWQEGEDSTLHLKQADSEYNDYSDRVLDVMDRMLNKYQQLIFNESLRDSPSAEMVMVERMFLSEERQQLEHDKQLVRQNPDLFKPKPYIPAPVVKKDSLDESFSDESECGDNSSLLERSGSVSSHYTDVKDCKVVLSPLPAGTNYEKSCVRVKTESGNPDENTVQVKQEPLQDSPVEKTDLVSRIKVEKYEEDPLSNVPSPSYTVVAQNSGQGSGLKMVFKSSPAHSPCPSPTPSTSRPVNQFSDISDIEAEEAEPSELIGITKRKEAGPSELIDRTCKKPRLDCDNNNLQHNKGKSVGPGALKTSSFANQYEEFLRQQSIKEEEASPESTNSPPFLDFSAKVPADSKKPHSDRGIGIIRSLGFDTVPSSSAETCKSEKTSATYTGCATLAGLLMGSDSDSEKSQPVTVGSLNHQQGQHEPIEIDLTLSPVGVAVSSQGDEDVTMTTDGGDKAEMQNAIESILGLEQDFLSF